MHNASEGAFETAAETLFILRGLAACHDPEAKIIRQLTAEALVNAIDELGLYEDGQLNPMARIVVDERASLLPQDRISQARMSDRLCYLRSCALVADRDRKLIGSVSADRIVNAIDTYLRGAIPPIITFDQPRDDDPEAIAGLNLPRTWRQAASGTRRFSWPRPRAGELKVQWGYSADDGHDLFFCGGEGVPRADRALMHYALAAERWTGPFEGMKFEPSLIEQLACRGYDPETLRLSIRKKS
jgi:hypothetical protein